MSPWQQYLWRLANPEAAERERREGEPVVIDDECPATDGYSLEELMRIARRRAKGIRTGEVPRPKRVRPSRLVSPDIRCAASINPQNGAEYGVSQRCRKRARLPGYFCSAHAGHAPPTPKCMAITGEGS